MEEFLHINHNFCSVLSNKNYVRPCEINTEHKYEIYSEFGTSFYIHKRF